jgi:hypothetical protein
VTAGRGIAPEPEFSQQMRRKFIRDAAQVPGGA